jgi:hypothetical protein
MRLMSTMRRRPMKAVVGGDGPGGRRCVSGATGNGGRWIDDLTALDGVRLPGWLPNLRLAGLVIVVQGARFCALSELRRRRRAGGGESVTSKSPRSTSPGTTSRAAFSARMIAPDGSSASNVAASESRSPRRRTSTPARLSGASCAAVGTLEGASRRRTRYQAICCTPPQVAAVNTTSGQAPRCERMFGECR